MNAAHFFAVLLLHSVFQETARYPVCIHLFNTIRCQFHDELPECNAARIEDSVFEALPAGASWRKTACQVFWGELKMCETDRMLVSSLCDGLAAPQQVNDAAITMVSATSGGLASPQPRDETTSTVHSGNTAPEEGRETALYNMDRGLAAPKDRGETALAVVAPTYYYDICPAISPSETYALAVWSKREPDNRFFLVIPLLTICIIVTHVVLRYYDFKKEEEMFDMEVIVFIIVPIRQDRRRRG